ncbi:MAG: hypothetical protein HRT91_01270 [Piscirickettsiaceae bacterium]|nr:hypothetical protein [Piscirickettsiaceae bacterium]
MPRLKIHQQRTGFTNTNTKTSLVNYPRLRVAEDVEQRAILFLVKSR